MKKFITILCFFMMINSVVFAASTIEIPEYILVKTKEGIVKEVELEEYLYSVVQSEMGTKYLASGMSKSKDVPLESLKAQAVASRSYAAYKIVNAGEDAEYHVTSNVSSQVYNENANIADIVKEAVDSTKGQVVIYDDKIACTYFSSTSGGHTESSENVWSGALPYLRGVEDTYEIIVDNKTTWTAKYTNEEMQNSINNYLTALEKEKAGINADKVKDVIIGTIKEINILDYSENDRVTEIEFVCKNETVTSKKNNMRMALGSSKLRSQWFDVEFDGDTAIFTGRGYGHGVGMSQNGAIGMGLEGFSYDEILTWYYTDIEIYGFKGSTSKKDNTDKEEYKEEYYIPVEEVSKKDIPKPLLDKTIEVITTNWLMNFLNR